MRSRVTVVSPSHSSNLSVSCAGRVFSLSDTPALYNQGLVRAATSSGTSLNSLHCALGSPHPVAVFRRVLSLIREQQRRRA